jgi:hypothetical protein
VSLFNPNGIWTYAMRVSGDLDAIAHVCGVQPGDPRLGEMLRAMKASGFLHEVAPGKFEPLGDMAPAPDAIALSAGAEPPGQRGAGEDRPAPAGVPPGMAPPPAAAAPAAAAPEQRRTVNMGVGDGTVPREGDGVPVVADDRLDRVAKADMLPQLEELRKLAQNYREQLETDELGDDVDTMVDKLLDAVDKMSTQVGYGRLGEVGDTEPYDPERHIYTGIVPETGITSEVIIYRPGETWTHRGRVFVTEKAWVELYDEENGGYSISSAHGLEGDDENQLIRFDDASPFKPSNYDETKADLQQRGIWEGFHWAEVKAVYTCQDYGFVDVCPLHFHTDECPTDCDEADADGGKTQEECDGMVLLFTGEDEDAKPLHVPADLLLHHCPDNRY